MSSSEAKWASIATSRELFVTIARGHQPSLLKFVLSMTDSTLESLDAALYADDLLLKKLHLLITEMYMYHCMSQTFIQ